MILRPVAVCPDCSVVIRRHRINLDLEGAPLRDALLEAAEAIEDWRADDLTAQVEIPTICHMFRSEGRHSATCDRMLPLERMIG